MFFFSTLYWAKEMSFKHVHVHTRVWEREPLPMFLGYFYWSNYEVFMIADTQ